jgi:branched-subunit amino acid transport protein
MIPALILLAVGTFVMKAVGPVAAAGRRLPPTIDRLTPLLPAALLAALVATQTLGGGNGLTLDARIVGVGAAGIAVACRAPFGVVVLVGAAVTAAVRLLGWG